jgi:hypothetical protein
MGPKQARDRIRGPDRNAALPHSARCFSGREIAAAPSQTLPAAAIHTLRGKRGKLDMCDLFALAVIPGSAVCPEATQHVEDEIINVARPVLQNPIRL